ncbi:MAG: hypothetical protein H6830_10135 [Planctomycetes bacterium]|nr:hypothetical protein [Planctomycetota bacterium]MCB9909471.1 hypothetical protein [Planctomycetota bacterium]HPF13571.1 hypothetical protein [Planctomycetota bacterium]HRV83018.1 hypothetical protein [Planctomycetota bacterium]
MTAFAHPLLRTLPLLLLMTACVGTRKGVDPTVRILSERGNELGVSTQYGIVFLGRHTNAGPVEVEAMFGDGPSIESSVVDPLGGGLYTAETDIRLPAVPLTFQNLEPGQEVLLRGRSDRSSWQTWVKVRQDERVHGILLEVPRQLDGHPDQIGAGVFLKPSSAPYDLRLIGLVSGRIRLETDGKTKTFLTVEGPESLWRLVTHNRKSQPKRKWVYREDVL